MEGLVPAAQCGQKSCSLRRSFLLYSKRAFKSFLFLLGGGGGRCNLQAVSLLYYTFSGRRLQQEPLEHGAPPGPPRPAWQPLMLGTFVSSQQTRPSLSPPSKTPHGAGGGGAACGGGVLCSQRHGPCSSGDQHFLCFSTSTIFKPGCHSQNIFASCTINYGHVFKHREEKCTCFPMHVEPVLSNIIYAFVCIPTPVVRTRSLHKGAHSASSLSAHSSTPTSQNLHDPQALTPRGDLGA